MNVPLSTVATVSGWSVVSPSASKLHLPSNPLSKSFVPITLVLVMLVFFKRQVDRAA